MSKYNVNGNSKNALDLTYDDLIILCNQFYNKHQNIIKRDFKSENNLPSINTVLRILCDKGLSYYDFINQYKNKRSRKRAYDADLFDIYVNEYKQLSTSKSKPLSTHDFYKNNLPPAEWFVQHCPDKTINNWTDFVLWCGFTPYFNRDEMIYNKDFVIRRLLEFEKELGRPIRLRDIKHDTIGFSNQIIYDLWGSLEQCKKEVGLMSAKGNIGKSWEYYDEMMKIALNNIYKVTNRKELTWQDFLQYKNIPLSKDGFKNACIRYDVDLYDYFNTNGFELINKSGSGYVTRFQDGELCKSSYEQKYSIFLRNNNIIYKRNIKYKTLLNDLVNTDIDCDYVLYNGLWIEICGMIRATSDNWKTKKFNNRIFCDYQEKMLYKEQILKSVDVPYLFLFQDDFDNNKYIDKTLKLMQQMQQN